MKVQARVLRVGDVRSTFKSKDGILEFNSRHVDLAVLRSWQTLGDGVAVPSWDKIRVEYIYDADAGIAVAEGDGVEATISFDIVEGREGGSFQNVRCNYLRKVKPSKIPEPSDEPLTLGQLMKRSEEGEKPPF